MASASIFRLIWFSLLHNVGNRVRSRTARFGFVFCNTDGYGIWKNWESLGVVRLGYVRLCLVSTQYVLSVATPCVLEFVIHFPYVVDACALPRILPSQSMTDMMYCTPEKKPTPTSVSTFRVVSISFFHIVVKRVRNSTRHSVVFSVSQTVLSIFDVYCACGSARTYTRLNYMSIPIYYLIPG
jgi:hypothetical protein